MGWEGRGGEGVEGEHSLCQQHREPGLGLPWQLSPGSAGRTLLSCQPVALSNAVPYILQRRLSGNNLSRLTVQFAMHYSREAW